MVDDIKILLTGSGAPGTRGTIYCIQEGAKKSGNSVEIIGVDRNPLNSGIGFCSKIYEVPSPEDVRYPGKIRDICLQEKIDLILPQTTREIEAFSQGIIQDCNAKVLVNPSSVISFFNDKIKTAEIFRDNKLGYPDFRVPSNIGEFESACHELGYPRSKVVVKLAVSNGMRGLRILNSMPWNYEKFRNEKPSGVEIRLEEMKIILESAPTWPRLVVCEYLEGDEYSVDCFRGKAGELAIPRKRNIIRSGISFQTTLERNTEIIESSLQVARLGGLTGVFGFQFKMKDGKPKVLECNPRVQGTMVASLISGNNLIWAAIAELLPKKIKPYNLNQDWNIGSCYRYWGAVLERKISMNLEIV
jgi:carbamoyl-phosphate synthase large subunit